MIAGLPYDAEVEYLESTGTQYVDTGIVAKASDKCELSVKFSASQGSSAFVGAANDSGRLATVWMICGGAIRFGGGQPMGIAGMWNNAGEWNNVEMQYSGIDVNGYIETNGSVYPFNDTYSVQNIYLFRCNSFTIPSVDIYIRSFKWYRGTELIQDLIPVRFKNELGQAEGAMYDRVSRKLFRNQGTGDPFVLGPDKAATSVPVMGLHFMRSPATPQ